MKDCIPNMSGNNCDYHKHGYNDKMMIIHYGDGAVTDDAGFKSNL